MKQLLILLLLSFSFCLFAQNEEAYFKMKPVAKGDDPTWVQQMYATNPNVYQVINLYESYYKEHQFVKSIHTQNYKHWLKNIADKIDDAGYLRTSQPYALDFKNSLKKERDSKNLKNSIGIWTTIGPFETFDEDAEQGIIPVSWQVNVYCLDQSITNPNILVAGSESMGAWKSTDKGINWTSITKNEDIRTVTDIKIAPSNQNIIYLSSNNGIYKSTNGGNSWSLTLNNTAIYQIVIHPTNPNIVFTVGPNGLHQTVDGGNFWSNDIPNKCWDINFHPTDPSIIYLLQHNSNLQYTTFWKSTNTGATWNQQTTGWYNPVNLYFNAHLDMGALIAVTPIDPDKVYVAMLGNHKEEDNAWIGVYKSSDSGASWSNPIQDGGPYSDPDNQNLATINRTNGFTQGFYDFGFDASHTTAGKLYLGVLALSVSDDDGSSWTRIGGYHVPEESNVGWIHPDIQDIHVLGADVWIATDGGINYSNDEMQTHESRKNGIVGSHYWGLDQGWNEDVIVGGRYHNGNSVLYNAYGLGNATRLGGGEAPTGYTDLMNPLVNYFSDIQTASIHPSEVGKVDYLSALSLYPHEAYLHALNSEIVRDPRYAHHLYLGAASPVQNGGFWKSIDNGKNFTLLHDFGDGKVTGIEISNQNSARLYCVYDGNKIYKSSDAGNTWAITTNIATNANLLISINPSNEDELWAFANTANTTNKVFRTLDGGQTWTNLTTPILENTIINDGFYQGGSNALVYIVGAYELYYWNEQAADWEDYHAGLPFVMGDVKNIFKPFYRDSKIRLSSVRGIWEAPFKNASLPIAQPMTTTDSIFCSRDTVQFDDHSILNHSNAQWEWTFSLAPEWINSAQIRNPKVLLKDGESYDVTLTITDGQNNSDTKTVTNMVTVQSNCEISRTSLFALNTSNSGDWVQTPFLDKTVNNLTIGAWVKPNGIQPEYSGIVINDGETAGFNFRENNNTLAYHWPGGAWWWDSGLELPANEWSYVAMVATPQSMTLYLNGQPSVHNANLNPVALTTLKIGSYKGWGGRNFKGEIDDVCIWERALSQDEIRELQHLIKSPIEDQSILAYYQFDEASGSVLDRSRNYHASLQGNAYRNISTAPFGYGDSDRLSINNPGNYNLVNSGMELVFDANGTNPQGEIVGSRILSLPDSLSSEKAPFKEYWIINNYGNNQNSILKQISFTPTMQVPPHLVVTSNESRLNWRQPFEHLNNWVEAPSISYADNVQLVYSNLNMLSSGQFLIQDKNCPNQLYIPTLDVTKNLELYAKSTIVIDDFNLAENRRLTIKSPIVDLNKGQTTNNNIFIISNIDGCQNE